MPTQQEINEKLLDSIVRDAKKKLNDGQEHRVESEESRAVYITLGVVGEFLEYALMEKKPDPRGYGIDMMGAEDAQRLAKSMLRSPASAKRVVEIYEQKFAKADAYYREPKFATALIEEKFQSGKNKGKSKIISDDGIKQIMDIYAQRRKYGWERNVLEHGLPVKKVSGKYFEQEYAFDEKRDFNEGNLFETCRRIGGTRAQCAAAIDAISKKLPTKPVEVDPRNPIEPDFLKAFEKHKPRVD